MEITAATQATVISESPKPRLDDLIHEISDGQGPTAAAVASAYNHTAIWSPKR
jgi:hypothetical protein